jgi:hypothetical protein
LSNFYHYCPAQKLNNDIWLSIDDGGRFLGQMISQWEGLSINVV